jgi:OmpA-OmpF porin, OOP family
MRPFAASIVGLLALMPALPARADLPGWYLGAGGGWSKVEDMKSGAARVELDKGFAALGFAGYDFGALRVEGEIDDRHAYAHRVTTATGAGGGASGNIMANALMVNGIYSLLPERRWTPYVGLGVGGARLAADHLAAAGVDAANGSATKPAYQGIAGVSYRAAPNISLALDYRYFATLDPTFTGAAGAVFTPHYHTHNVLLSVTYRFGRESPPPSPTPAAAPPPPTPAAMPAATPVAPTPAAPRRVFLVFFDFDQATLTPAGGCVVELAANAYRTTGTARIDLTGYTDLAGGVAYNLKLAQRRADAVRDHLVKLGVPASAISETARGKQDPRVPTADGVREPQNRRVEILLP